jgi:hypothetical protein
VAERRQCGVQEENLPEYFYLKAGSAWQVCNGIGGRINSERPAEEELKMHYAFFFKKRGTKNMTAEVSTMPAPGAMLYS